MNRGGGGDSISMSLRCTPAYSSSVGSAGLGSCGVTSGSVSLSESESKSESERGCSMLSRSWRTPGTWSRMNRVIRGASGSVRSVYIW